jgi:hypothetical protein
MANFDPLPSEPTAEMRVAYEMFRADESYPLPAGQAALWAVLANYADDPIAWTARVLELSDMLIEDVP